jgi:hypothetical protein
MRHPILVLSIVTLLTVMTGARRSAAATTNFTVVNDAMVAWSIDGVDNPGLTLTRGETYVFNVSATGHPFWITTARGASAAPSNAFSAGVTGNGTASGTVTFVVPASAPSTLFYQCGVHNAMGGTLTIVGSPAPLGGAPILAVFTGLLLAAAVVMLRKRRLAPAQGGSHLS